MAEARQRVEAVIFAGGVGRRMGGGPRPKQFLELGGRPIIDYTIAHFAEHPLVTRVVVACLPDWAAYLREVLDRRRYATPIDIVDGGATGQESIFNGLDHLHRQHPDDDEAIVLVHDGVRPLIDAETISACVASVVAHGPTATVAPATETVIIMRDGCTIDDVPDRGACYLARAPQAFRLEELHAAHLWARREGRDDFVDSVSLMRHLGHTIHTVEGPVENIKVTTPTDYYAFRAFMEARDQAQLWSGA